MKKIIKIIKRIFIVLGLLLLIFIAVVFYTFSITSKETIISKKINYTDSIRFSPSGHILVNVYLDNDTTAYPFILDNGATTIIFKNLLEKKHFNKIAYLPTRDINKKYSLNPVYDVGKIKLESGIEVDNITSKMFDIRSFSCNKNVYGIIGRDIITHFIWQFDFEKGIYSVSNNIKNLKIENNSSIVPIHQRRTNYYLNAKINNNQNQKLFIDIGSSSSIDYELLQDSTDYYFKNKKVTMTGVFNWGLNGNNKDITNLVLIDSLSMGDYKIHNIEATVSNKTLSVIGLGFFKNYKVTFNFPKRELILRQNKESKFTYEHFGIGFSFSDSVCLVDFIVEEALPYKKGIRLNDKVIEINNMPIDDNFDKCQNIYNSDTLLLSIQKGDSIIDYILPQDYYFE